MLALTIKNTPRTDSQVVTFELGTIENTQKIPLEFIIFNFKLPLNQFFMKWFLKKVLRKTFLKGFFATANFYQIAS